MTWQDDLRTLEQDLVNGRVSAEEYRKRRDQLLSSASTPGQAEPENLDQTQIIPPVPAAPTPPAPVNDRARSTAVENHDYQADADATQVVSSSGFDRQPASTEEPPPWANNEFPLLVGTTNSDWIKQGPETFSSSGAKKSSKGKIFGVIGSIVAVVILIGGGILLFTSGKDDNAGGQQPPSAPHSSQQPLGLLDPPGQAETHADVTDLTTMKKANYLNPSEVQAYADAVVTKVVFKVGKPGNGDTVAGVAAQAGSAEGAKSAVKKLGNIQISNNMVAQKGAPPNVVMAGLPRKPNGGVEFRAHWAHDGTILRISATGKNYDSVLKDFREAVDAQLKDSPANG